MRRRTFLTSVSSLAATGAALPTAASPPAVVQRRRRQHLSELHPTPSGEPCGRAGWKFRRHAGTLGRSLRRSVQFCYFGRRRRHDSVPGERSRHLQEIQWERWSVRCVAKSGVSGQYAVVQHHRTRDRSHRLIVPDVVLEIGAAPGLLTPPIVEWTRARNPASGLTNATIRAWIALRWSSILVAGRLATRKPKSIPGRLKEYAFTGDHVCPGGNMQRREVLRLLAVGAALPVLSPSLLAHLQEIGRA